MHGFCLMCRKLFLVCRKDLYSGKYHAAVFVKPQYYPYTLEFRMKNIHVGNTFSQDDRERVVTHIAEQEIAVSALRRLEMAVRKFQRVNKSDVQLVMKASLKDIFVQDKDVIFLIRCCGSLLANEGLEIRRNMSETVWAKMCNSGISLDNDHFMALLKTNFENQKPMCPQKFLFKMKSLGVDPTGETLRMLLSCLKFGEKFEENVKFVMDELKARGLNADCEFLGTLASLQAEKGNILEAENIMQSMKKRNFGIAGSAYVSLIKGHIIKGDKDSVLKLLAQMGEIGMELSAMEFASVVSKLAEVSSLPESKHGQIMKSVMPFISVPRGEKVHACVLNAMVELLHCGKGSAACSLLLHLPQELMECGGKFDEPLPLAFCRELARAPIVPEEVLKICCQLEESLIWTREGSLKPLALHAVIGHALQLPRPDLGLFLLEALGHVGGAPLRPHYFWPLLLTAAKREDEDGVLEVVGAMSRLAVPVDHETLAVYVLPFIRARSDAFEVLSLLRERGVQGPACRTALTHWLLDQGQLAEAARFHAIHRGRIDLSPLIEPLVRCIASKVDQPAHLSLSSLSKLLKVGRERQGGNIDYVGHFLLELSERLGLLAENGVKQEDRARATLDYFLRILKSLDARSVMISAQAADCLVNVLSPLVDEARPLCLPPVDDRLTLPMSSFQPLIPHPRDMSAVELEAHLVELRAKGLNDRGVLRRLLMLHCRERNLERALQVKRDMELAGHSFSPGMLSSVLDLLIHNGELEEAEDVVHKLKKGFPKFKLDDHKVIDLAALMSREGRVNEAVALLQGHAESTEVRPGRAIERNLLNLVLAVHECGGAGTTEGGAGAWRWTPGALLQELSRLGYITDPPPVSMERKLKELCG